MRWKEMKEGKEKYNAYLCSREWAVKKEAVHERANGTCERCKRNPVDHVHHLTYIRKCNERLEDLAGWCKGCHEFTHAKSDFDPAGELASEMTDEKLLEDTQRLIAYLLNLVLCEIGDGVREKLARAKFDVRAIADLRTFDATRAVMDKVFYYSDFVDRVYRLYDSPDFLQKAHLTRSKFLRSCMDRMTDELAPLIGDVLESLKDEKRGE